MESIIFGYDMGDFDRNIAHFIEVLHVAQNYCALHRTIAGCIEVLHVAQKYWSVSKKYIEVLHFA